MMITNMMHINYHHTVRHSEIQKSRLQPFHSMIHHHFHYSQNPRSISALFHLLEDGRSMDAEEIFKQFKLDYLLVS